VIVVDASTLTDVLLGRTAALDALGELTVGREHAPLHAPELIEPETLSALRSLVMRGELDASRADEAVLAMSSLRCVRYPHTPFRRRVWELRHNLTTYDALYLALTEALGSAVLITGDAGLAAQAERLLGSGGVRYVSG
jgi:predicted nucleic acid-binding protein